MLFEGFERNTVDTGEVTINYVTAGNGPPLLMLHGYPQTHSMWHRIAPALSRKFTVICADLRGYGDSGKPPSDESHMAYSKRQSGNDMVKLMDKLGFPKFNLVGHDRGARVAHRMCLDHADRIERVAILDIVPTYHIFSTADRRIATDYYHWFFLIQPEPFPEKMIGNDPLFYLHWTLGAWGTGLDVYDPEALREYERCFCTPESIHATCEDYRAAASVDFRHDQEDICRKVTCPMLVLWGKNGVMDRNYDVLGAWRARAKNVVGRAIEAGHFLAEEKPEDTCAELERFFSPA